LRYKKNQTAVLYFTRSADEEARAKTFCSSGNFAQNRAIAQRLIDHTYREIRTSELPIKIVTPESQKGSSFGEKLGNAFENLFDEGYENVIAVGNDCIELSAETLRYTARLLHENPLVAGPALDGGTYLLGINHKAFDKDTFCNLAWQTDLLLDDFVRYAQKKGYELTQLSTYADIDNEQGLRRFLSDAHDLDLYFRLVVLLLSVLSSSIYFYQKREVTFDSHHLRISLFHRGPPVS
jgi:glycosyltransferase A (GT-A) superfamily protein (DUF2064 family)